MSTYRPQYASRRGGWRDRDNRDGRNGNAGSYRGYQNVPPPSSFIPPPPPPGTDHWRHGSYDRRESRMRSPPRYNDGARRGPQDFREPRPPQGDFSFRMEKPAGVGDTGPGNSYRPGQDQGRRYDSGRGRHPGPRRFRSGYVKVIPAERQLLSSHKSQVREDLCAYGENSVTYRDIEDLSDDEEAEMDISDQSGDDAGQPSAKRARGAASQGASGDSVPKWSNPDAETALPPPDEGTRKKKNMVQLIRKARIEDNSAAKLAASTEAEDFISFDMGGDDAAGGTDGGDGSPPTPGPATGKSGKNGTSTSRDAPAPAPSTNLLQDMRNNIRTSDPLGSRKRTIDDEIKPPSYGPLKKVSKMPVQGHVLPEWLPIPDEDSWPWLTTDHSRDSEMSVWLHKEIVDFYEYVRPRAFEHRMRSELVERIRACLRTNTKYNGCQVFPFGSFMSGLYLPNADMDIVICSKNWLQHRPTAFPTPSSLHRFRAFLTSNKLADGSSTEVIGRARVPLVKYIDVVTGLRVDISFDRMDGPSAIKTFLNWKEQYPALPILVTLVKHFLMMRGLHEPVNGGIGSFSVSCMVMSMLQLMPQVQSRSLVPEHHLGEMLMEFFDLYGNRFDYRNTAIRINPPGYVRKSSNKHNLTYKNMDRLSIIDPNNSSNDVAGGSSNIEAVVYEFSLAHTMIKKRMAAIAQDKSKQHTQASSILEVIFAGNYRLFRLQRAHLRRLHEKYIGPCED
ncbi:hypothetical protein ACRALDRAFT_1073934 [Sodiomyces alcalophilus JCM 7366]|uniref:uncharacterized protein n=1 Tax=Sodiomyces alcalophilus JCM 7366 TaxID=591952 RepID=UPI0039B3E4DE